MVHLYLISVFCAWKWEDTTAPTFLDEGLQLKVRHLLSLKQRPLVLVNFPPSLEVRPGRKKVRFTRKITSFNCSQFNDQ